MSLSAIKSEVPGKASQILASIRGSAALTGAVGTETLRLFALNQGSLAPYLTSQIGTNGQLPDPEQFLITGIRFTLLASNGFAPLFYDFYDVFLKSVFELKISNKTEFEGALVDFLPPNIVVPIDSKPEQTRCVNLASFVSLKNNPIKIDPGRQYELNVSVTKTIAVSGNAYGAAGYSSNYGTLYLNAVMSGFKEVAVK